MYLSEAIVLLQTGKYKHLTHIECDDLYELDENGEILIGYASRNYFQIADVSLLASSEWVVSTEILPEGVFRKEGKLFQKVPFEHSIVVFRNTSTGQLTSESFKKEENAKRFFETFLDSPLWEYVDQIDIKKEYEIPYLGVI